MTARIRDGFLMLMVGLIAAGGGYAYNAWRMGPETAAASGTEALLSTRLPDLSGKPQALAQWEGKILVVNFWATWCAPCREEIPMFVELQGRHGARGVQFVGIALDQADKVRPYAAELKMNYPVLIGDIGAIDLSRKLGNHAGVLPFTVILGRDGKIASQSVGLAKNAELERLLFSL